MARKPFKGTKDVKAAADRAEKRAKGEAPKIAKVEIDPVVATAEEIKAKMGRPTKYKPEYALVASALCKRGATDAELAEEFDVSTVTIWRWTVAHDDFRKACLSEKAGFDERVVRSLAQRAIGYSYSSEKVFNFQGSIVRAAVTEHVPPDVSAIKHWLANRCPNEWREAVQRQEHGNPGDFGTMSDEELNSYIEAEARELAESRKSVKGKPATKH